MIEIIYKEDQKKAEGNEAYFKIPNNIRQIGEIRGHRKIYIEDYAYTFLKKISRNPETGGKAAILFGEYHWAEDCAYIFIKSALELRDLEVSAEHVVFSDKVWGQVYDNSRKYFPEQEIVGWFVSLPGFNMQINEVLLKTHLNHFAGNDKTLFVLEPGEGEEAFYLYENNQLIRQPGYYIYYEKNDLMRSYMIDMSQNKSIEETEKVPDRAVMDFRKAVKEKKEEGKLPVDAGKSGTYRWIFGAGAAAAILAVGITFFNSYEEMKRNFGLAEQPAKQEAEESRPVSSDNTEAVLIPSVTEKPQSETASVQEWLGTEMEDESVKNQGETEKESVSETQSSEEINPPSEKEEKDEEQTVSAQVPGAMEEYVIQRGDTLTSICKNKYGSIARLEEICHLNGIAPDDIIYAGQKLKLPE